MKNFVLTVVVIVFCAFGFPLFAQTGTSSLLSGVPMKEVLRHNPTLWLPARPGMDAATTLNLAFNSEVSEFDAYGKRHRVYAAGTTDTTRGQLYNASCTIIDSELEFAANASVLNLGTASATSTEEKRYAVFSVYHIEKTITFNPDGQPLQQADFLALKVHYGWAVHYVVSGASNRFTASVSANLQEVLNAGGDIKTVLTTNNLEMVLRVQGLQPKETNLVFTQDQIRRNFTRTGEAQPIFVELLPMKNFTVPRIPWRTGIRFDGRYMLDSVRIELTERTNLNEEWDNDSIGGNKPDISAVISVIVTEGDSFNIVTDTIPNTTSVTFPISRTFSMSSLFAIIIVPFDIDPLPQQRMQDSTRLSGSLSPFHRLLTEPLCTESAEV